MEDKKKKRDIILVAGILTGACIFFIGNRILFSKPAISVEVSIDGTVVETLDLNKDTEITINGYNNGTNHLVIKDGEVSVDDASCPDAVCIHQGKIHKSGEMIVCLPNLMIAQIVGGEE